MARRMASETPNSSNVFKIRDDKKVYTVFNLAKIRRKNGVAIILAFFLVKGVLFVVRAVHSYVLEVRTNRFFNIFAGIGL